MKNSSSIRQYLKEFLGKSIFPRNIRKIYFWPIGIFVAGVIATISLYFFVKRSENIHVFHDFTSDVRQYEYEFQRELEYFVVEMRGVGGLFASSEIVDAQEFRNFLSYVSDARLKTIEEVVFWSEHSDGRLAPEPTYHLFGTALSADNRPYYKNRDVLSPVYELARKEKKVRASSILSYRIT